MILDFGKYKGIDIKSLYIPYKYISWLVYNNDLHPNDEFRVPGVVVDEAIKELEKRNKKRKNLMKKHYKVSLK